MTRNSIGSSGSFVVPGRIDAILLPKSFGQSSNVFGTLLSETKTMIGNTLKFVESLGLGGTSLCTREILAQFWESAFPVPIDISSSWDISKSMLKNTDERYEFSSNTSGLTMCRPGQFGQEAIHLPF
jgi:hypothetical protein